MAHNGPRHAESLPNGWRNREMEKKRHLSLNRQAQGENKVHESQNREHLKRDCDKYKQQIHRNINYFINITSQMIE